VGRSQRAAFRRRSGAAFRGGEADEMIDDGSDAFPPGGRGSGVVHEPDQLAPIRGRRPFERRARIRPGPKGRRQVPRDRDLAWGQWSERDRDGVADVARQPRRASPGRGTGVGRLPRPASASHGRPLPSRAPQRPAALAQCDDGRLGCGGCREKGDFTCLASAVPARGPDICGGG
jgi:hypothetical protein